MIYDSGEDSFLLEEAVRENARGKKVLDVGSGSGIQAEAALEVGASEVLCVDIDEEVVDFLSEKGFRTIKSDLFSEVPSDEKFELIIFNPPYLPADKREDSESSRITSGGLRGDEIMIRFFSEVGDFLEKDGKILIVISSLTPHSRIAAKIKEKGFQWEKIKEKKIFMETLEVWEIHRKN